MDSARRRPLGSVSGPANRLSRKPGPGVAALPGERTKDSKPRRATGSGKVSCRDGVPPSTAKDAVPKQNKTRRIATLEPKVKPRLKRTPHAETRRRRGRSG